MLLKYMKESIKQKHACNGSKNNRNNYRIKTTASDYNRWETRKFKLSIRDNNYGIDKATLKHIKKEWLKAGYTIKQLNQIDITTAIKKLLTNC